MAFCLREHGPKSDQMFASLAAQCKGNKPQEVTSWHMVSTEFAAAKGKHAHHQPFLAHLTCPVHLICLTHLIHCLPLLLQLLRSSLPLLVLSLGVWALHLMVPWKETFPICADKPIG